MVVEVLETTIYPILETTIFQISISNSQLRQQFGIPVNQRFFLFSAPALYLFFAIKRFINSCIFLVIHQCYRQSFLRVIGPFAVLMLLQSQFQIRRASRIVAPVATFQYVHVPFLHSESLISKKWNYCLFLFLGNLGLAFSICFSSAATRRSSFLMSFPISIIFVTSRK